MAAAKVKAAAAQAVVGFAASPVAQMEEVEVAGAVATAMVVAAIVAVAAAMVAVAAAMQ